MYVRAVTNGRRYVQVESCYGVHATGGRGEDFSVCSGSGEQLEERCEESVDEYVMLLIPPVPEIAVGQVILESTLSQEGG